MKLNEKIMLIAGLTAVVSVPVKAIEMQEIKDAMRNNPTLNFRYRYEGVSQDGIAEDAGASTLRSRFSWQSNAVSNFSLGFEADYVSIIGSERYNSTKNGKVSYPVVADPEGFDLNQSYLNYKGVSATTTFGRQRIQQGSQRFIGGVAWRQNEQTYDAFRSQYTSSSKIVIDYAYVWNVNRIFGPDDGAQPSDWFGNSHLVTVTWPLAKRHTLEVYGYLLDFQNANGIPNSTETFGMGYKGSFGPVKLTGSVAQQSDYKSSPLDYDTLYYLLQLDLALSRVTFTAGYEVLGSDDGITAFRTPLATLHKFQGWADKFLVTPANGIEDIYIGAKGKVGPVSLVATGHQFDSDEGGLEYGTELDLVANYAFNEDVNLQLKYADYSAKGFARDTTKIWFSVILKI